jgi:TonB family protein
VSENKTIKNFSAADIEKYWSKKLSPAEMHEMEKAAMDDPFFADALEGYQNSNDPTGELAALDEKFNKKFKEETPVIPLLRKRYYWFRVAAAIIILLASGLLIQQLLFKTKNETPLAVAKKQNSTDNKDVKNEDGNTVNNDTISRSIDTLKNNLTVTEPAAIKPANKNNAAVDLNSLYAKTTIDSLKADGKTANTIVEKNGETIKDKDVALNKENVKREEEKKEAANDKTEVVSQAAVAERLNNKPEANAYFNKKALADDYKQNGLVFGNSFNYRVVDAQKNPVPFANVLNTRDNVGTYTDVRGYFNLVSSDSIMDVQVKSLGYNSERYRLVPSKQTGDIVLKEDATARNVFNFTQQQRVMSNAVRKDSAEVEEPEVGWGNYNTYVENNIKIPENVRAKNALNQVELSFDVDKSGTPINIKVTKSSKCKECDDEAIRLLKEGPKWKKKGKRSKTTISISVDQ